MPMFLANVLRFILIAAIQIGVFEIARAFLEKALTAITDALMTGEGQTREEAENNIAIEIISAVGALALNAALIKSRLPLRWTDILNKAKGKATLTPSGSVSTIAAGAVKTVTEKTRSFTASALKTLGLSFIASIPWLPSLLQNFLDQGTFNPTNANRALGALGLASVFQWPVAPKELQPGPYKAGEFIELFDELTAAGAIGINNEFEQQSQLWHKDNLSQLINAVVGLLVIQGKASDKRAIKAELSKYIISRPGIVTPAPSAPVFKGTTLATPRVFTGVITQGTLGGPLNFQTRPDDLIESMAELQTATQNNLAPFLASLASRVVYEIKVVSAITTKDGFRQQGQTRQIISGYFSNGQPKYRTVTNKFALLNMYILTERGARTKIATIVLGPTDATKFQPQQNELVKIENTMKDSILTSNVSEIINISAPAPVAAAPTPTAPPPPPTPRKIEDDYYKVRREGRAFVVEKSTNRELADAEIAARNININLVEEQAPSATVMTAPATTPKPAPTISVAPVPSPVTPILFAPGPKLGANAQTLYEWYTANGQALPSVAVRAPLYEKYGLGQAAYYIGTAEQNTKLLNALKIQ